MKYHREYFDYCVTMSANNQFHHIYVVMIVDEYLTNSKLPFPVEVSYTETDDIDYLVCDHLYREIRIHNNTSIVSPEEFSRRFIKIDEFLK